ncbi:MAG: DNA helicase RecQ [Planctomycetaceae bacterium]
MLLEVLQRYWGYNGFRPLQEAAMRSVLENRDSVVVLPTGGGKSLCYQAPAMCRDGLAVVVSPLISLMKDQVDALLTNGIPAAFVNSTQSPAERGRVADDIRGGRVKLLYVSPEKLVQERMIEFLKSQNITAFAIDEAHCVSEWGHDFRPEYRQLNVLRENFPDVGLHAYTATATERVRDDIAKSLRLRQPEILVGSFDRPNLIYKVEKRKTGLGQVREILDRHKRESGIIYCTTRNDVDTLNLELSGQGLKTRAYHAGMSDEDRRHNQEAFIEERCDIIVATVAFGMGIDKSNVRFVIHYGMPKALENYQQESGRSGRDGLEAECCLLYSGREMVRWRNMIDESPRGPARDAAMQSFEAMSRFATGANCRHRELVNYFGQDLPEEQHESCGACDVCLGQLDLVEDAMVFGQKILSSVFRQKERFAANHTMLVLKGSKEQRVLQFGHDQLSTYGILADVPQQTIRGWIEQLVGQGFLKKEGEFQDLKITPRGWELLRGQATPRLLKPAAPTKEKRGAAVIADSWDGVDRGLFDILRDLRRVKADAMKVPAYVVFSDTSLRDMARRRPTTIAGFHSVKGVGEKKLIDFGQEFISCIATYCQQQGVVADAIAPDPQAKTNYEASEPTETGPNLSALAAFRLFREGKSVAEVANVMSRATSTVAGYLSEFIRHDGVTDASPWVPAELIPRIEAATRKHGFEKLRPIFDELNGEVSYEHLRPAIDCLRVRLHFGEET